MSRLDTETILGLPVEQVYGFADMTMPDGTKSQKLVQRARTPEGAIVWEEVNEKLKAFDERFSKTDTIPGSWQEPTTEVLTPKERETADTIKSGGVTRLDMRRQLILGLGDPQTIIQHKALDDARIKFFQKHPSTLTLLYMMAKAHGGEWATAVQYIKPVYSDIH